MNFINQLFNVITQDPLLVYPGILGVGVLGVFVLFERIFTIEDEKYD